MRNLLSIFAVLITITSCSHNDVSINEDENPGSFIIDTEIFLTYQDSSGHNLLDSTIQNHFEPSAIKLFYLKDGVKEEVYDPKMDMPRNFDIRIVNGEPVLHLFADADPTEYTSEKDGIKYGESVALLELNKNTTDTIKTGWAASNHYFTLVKIGINSELKWKVGEKFKGPFVIIK